MKRALALLVGGVLILGSALAAHAQAPTVSFGGPMRVYGFAFNNITDFTDSGPNGANRDSQSFYFQRWRLFTNVESADKKAKAVWGLEVGDITWGTGGGASGGEYPWLHGPDPVQSRPSRSRRRRLPGTPSDDATVVTQPGCERRGWVTARVGVSAPTASTSRPSTRTSGSTPGSGLPGSSLTLGIQNIVFMTGPLGGYFDDDGAAIKINMKFDPVDVEVYAAKTGEGNNANADDTDMYVARVGVNATKDIRVTLEGMLVNEQALAGANLGDTFWIGATVGAKIGTIQLDGAVVYGQRPFAPAPALSAGEPGNPFSESGIRRLRDGAGPGGPRQRVRGWAGTPRVTDRSGRRAAAWRPASSASSQRGLQRSGYGPRPDAGLGQAPDSGVRRRLVRRRRPVHRGVALR